MKESVPSVKGELIREALSWAKTILFALIFAWFFTKFVIVNAIVPTGSMEDTIRIKDRIIAFRLSYMFSEPKRFDIIIFPSPNDDDLLYVKRIIGLPGDKLSIKNGTVYVNEKDTGNKVIELCDHFVKGDPTGVFPQHLRAAAESSDSYITIPYDTEEAAPFITIPEGYYFVLGDNRNESSDSRHWCKEGTLRTFVPRDEIQGKVLFRYFPGVQNLAKACKECKNK